MNTKRWLALVLAIVLLFVSIGFKFTINLASGFLNDVFTFDDYYFDEEIIADGDWDSRIAVLNLEGIIMGGDDSLFSTQEYQHDEFIGMIHQAAEDPTVEAIILQINSPGGAVGETAQIHRALTEMQDEFDKPLYVSMGSMAASGGYYAAAPADKIFAEPATITGSIGVIMENMNFAGLAEKYGVTFNTIKSGKHKDIMSSSRDMTKEEKEILQSIIDEMYDDFVQVIVDGRKMDEATVREVGDGRIYTGRQAQEVGLVDEIGTFDDTLNAVRADYDLEDAQVIQYGYGLGFFNMFAVKAQNLIQGKNSELDVVMSLLRQSDKPRAMYIY
ncbi:signal peptide peptidase SppA [Pseudogracilibacillus auburnensis]|uniref:Protease-4 n=1 Tax=Pseudogracilibacillus auburnensis TaxID=1494959 RepID=A0A2V3VR42_9BACI|nr:signal peptide peptidase SppA [Pseudogracilibacillus auburnensis]MBO1001430.1 signal peptide peptidase SppA [Pseudogracilibacillus auburnensis]PXW82475.1 protease-4 [Pseudogracilibacillus auburnensis]